MSIRDLFGGKKKVVKSTNLQSDFNAIESFDNFTEQIKKKNRFIPDVNYYTASSFAFFGSAEEYYRSAFYNISSRYPYDGSKKEITEFLNDSSYLDNFIFENVYPRYNGYAIISSNGWGTLNGSLKGTYNIGQPNTSEYIYFNGGPNTASSGMEGIPLSTTFSASNIYDTDIYSSNNALPESRVGTRESNLKTNFNNGVAVEFWSKLNFSAGLSALNATQVLFDLWNGYASGSNSYGRIIVGFSDANEALRIEVSSGSQTYSTFVSSYVDNIGNFTDTEMYQDNDVWNHYAFVFNNQNSGLNLTVYKNGTRRVNEEIIASELGEISGPLKATIGALQTAPSGSEYHGLTIGAGKMSGSIDEFRFWKSTRTQEQVILYKNEQVGGGTNTDLANTELGVYYKFNEGITGTGSYDSRVLDYSGRITNGNWIGYPGTTARSTNSAMVESGVSSKEFKDPVIYQNHPTYLSTLANLVNSAVDHDSTNSSMMKYNFPDFIIEEDENAGQELMKLNQIISSEFDSIYLLIKNLYKNKENTPGYSNPIITSTKPDPNNQRLLESFGLETDELFPYQTLLEYVQNRNMYSDYDRDLTEVKNEIYKNIYNNLIYLYKSKGTEKSIRNLLRSAGINEEIIKLNGYAKNATYVLEDRYSDDTYSKRYINFFTDDTYSSTIFQSASSNPNALGQNYITGSLNKYQSFTSEVNVVFPRNTNEGIPSYYKREFTQSSIYGFHLVTNTASFDWPTSNNNNIEVYAVRPSKYTNEAYFLLTDREGSFQLTSSVYKDVYSNSEWTFAVRFYNDKYPYASDFITGSSTGLNYKLDFVGYNTEGSFVKNQFKLTQNLNSTKAENMILSKKRYYAGAIRQNFTGSVETQSDIKLGFMRHYDLYLPDESIEIHSIDRRNFGVDFPYQTAFMLNGTSNLNKLEIGKLEFNNFNIDFETVTGSDSNGKFLALDFSSGSLDYSNRYPTIGSSLATQYEFTGYGFPASSTSFINREILVGSKLRGFENINSSDMVNILERDDEIFTRDYDVESITFALEKSYYNVISKEMLDFFGGIVSFNNIIGEVTEKYRDEYSKLRYLRNRFFERITDFATFERFYSYFRWIDDSIANFVQQLLPESSVYTNNVRDIIESHILERNKVKYHYPYFDYHGNTRFVDPEVVGKVKSIKELKKNWRYASPPIVSGSVSTNQNIHKDRWKYYQERNSSLVSSGIDIVDKQRENIRRVKNSTPNKIQDGLSYETGGVTVRYLRTQDDTPGTNTVSSYEVTFENGKTIINGGVNSKFQKNLKIFKDIIQRQYDANSGAIIGGTAKTSSVEFSNTTLFPEEDLELYTKNKKKYNEYKTSIVNKFDLNKTSGVEQFSYSDQSEYNRQFLLKDSLEHHFPGTILSASVTEGPFAGKLANISNIHADSTHDTLEVPMQGVFTSEHVGGLQYRHQGLNISSATDATNRAEGFKIQLDSTNDRVNLLSPQTDGTSTTTNVNTPFAVYTRDEISKRPVNLKNIKYSTSTRLVGNYEKESDIMLLSGRTENNRSFVRAEGFSTASNGMTIVSGFSDFEKPNRTFATGTVYEGKTAAITQHVIVNRFSAPGGPETAGDNQGGPGLDYEAAEYSPYNNLNYRNLTIRNPLNRTMLVDHANFGGLTSLRTNASVYPALLPLTTQSANTYFGLASYHKVNKNAKRVPTQTSANDFDATNSGSLKYIYNNPYVNWQVPGSDLQYSWIRKSYKTSEIIDYQSKDGLVSSSNGYVEEITFMSASDLTAMNSRAEIVAFPGTYLTFKGFGIPGYQQQVFGSLVPSILVSAPSYINHNISGLNTEFYEPTRIFGQNVGYLTLGYESSYIASATKQQVSDTVAPIYGFDASSYITSLPYTYLNILLHNRNGVYGHTSFKQIRVGDSKLGRYLRNSNTISFNERPGEQMTVSVSGTNGQTQNIKFIRNYKVLPTLFTEPPVSNGTPPLKVAIYSTESERLFSLKAEHGLELTYFTREDINSKLNLSKKYGITAAESLFSFYKENPNFKPIQLIYGESVYPKNSNRFLNTSRSRTDFVSNFWKSEITDRQLLGLSHPTKYYVKTNNIVSGGGKVVGIFRSSWNLDFIKEFETADFATSEIPSATTSAREVYSSSSNPGILQNYLTYNKASNIAGTITINTASVIENAPVYARPHFERWANSVVSPWGMDIKLSNGTSIKDLNSTTDATNLLQGTGYAKWEANTQAGKYQFSSDPATGEVIKEFVVEQRDPFYNSYADYSDDIRKVAKDMTVIPEYRVSSLTDRVLGGTNPASITDFLSIPQTIGSGTYVSKEFKELNSSDAETFYQVYTNTDFMKHFELVRQTNKDVLVNDTITLRCKAVKKFLPYDGFYPSERTAELADLFFKTYTNASIGASQGSVFNIVASGSDKTILTEKNSLRPTLQALFAPGLLFNTIKSGVAVDYPVYTASFSDTSSHEFNVNVTSNLTNKTSNSNFHTRLPFETLWQPERLNGQTIRDGEINRLSSFDQEVSNGSKIPFNKIRLDSSKKNYEFAMNNFLAETERFFLKNGGPTKIRSLPESQFKPMSSDNPYGMRIKMFRSLNRPQESSGSWGDYPVPQITFSGSTTTKDYYLLLNKYMFDGGPYSYAAPGGAVTGDSSYDSNLTLLTSSIVLSGALGQYTISGATSYTTSDVNFKIYSSTGSNSSNYYKTAVEIMKAINSGSSGVEFRAEYLNAYQIPNESGDNTFKQTILGSQATTTNNDPITYSVLKITTVDPNIAIIPKISLSNSVGDGGAFTNSTINQFIVKSDNLPTKITTQFTDQATYNGVLQDFNISEQRPIETLTMYSRPTAFGQPQQAVLASDSSTLRSRSVSIINGYNYGFTPPYYYGESWLDVIYVPASSGTANDLDSILTLRGFDKKFNTTGSNFSGLYVKQWRFDKEAGTNPGTDLPMRDGNVNTNAMQLDASLDFLKTEIDENGERYWSIQPKFETPILNFNHLTSSSDLTYPTGPMSASVPRGMWHQFGRIPTGNEGIYIQVSPIPVNWLENHPSASILPKNNSTLNAPGYDAAGNYLGGYSYKTEGDLLPLTDYVGFPTAPVKIGEIAETKKIKEAIVAIPFVEENGTRKYFQLEPLLVSNIINALLFVINNSSFMPRDYDELQIAINQVKSKSSALDAFKFLDNSATSQLIQKMIFYNIPKQFDFAKDKFINAILKQGSDVPAVAMYLFEFTHAFSKDDLSYMWQGLLPDVGVNYEFAESSITHPLLTSELLSPELSTDETKYVYSSVPEKVQWMVFKVKQKAEKDFTNVIDYANKKGSDFFRFVTDPDRDYSYNWPYDYFSLIEMAKMDVEVSMTPERTYTEKGTTIYTSVGDVTGVGKIIRESGGMIGKEAPPALKKPSQN